MAFCLFFIYFFLFTAIYSLAEDSDLSASIFAPDADNNVEDPYFATLLSSSNVAELPSADASIFDDTSLGSSTSENQNNLFSASHNLDGSTNLALVHSTSPWESLFVSSNLLYSTQDIESNNLFSSSDQLTDQERITQSSDSISLALPSGNNIGEPEHSQSLSFLDSDTPILPFNPVEIIQNIFPDLIPDLSPILPFDPAPLTGPPICDENYFPFCCNEGPPNPAKDEEKQKRRRACYDCELRLPFETL